MGSKKMMLAAVLLVVLLAAVPVCAEGDYTDTAAVMRLGLGARALGMGGAHIAVADDAAVIYYNPAGLGRLEEFSLTSMYSNQYGAGSYFGLGAAGMNLGAAVLRFGSSGIEETDEYGNPIGEFGVSETAAIAGYGRTVFSGLSVGGALKYYNQDLPGNSGSGFTADVGILYELLEGKALVGLVGRNLFGSVSYASGLKDSFERSFGVGVSFTPMENLLVAADAVNGRRPDRQSWLGIRAARRGPAGGGILWRGILPHHGRRVCLGELPDRLCLRAPQAPAGQPQDFFEHSLLEAECGEKPAAAQAGCGLSPCG